MTYTYKNEPLPILISSRIRLSEEQRKTLKDAYYEKRSHHTPPAATNNLTGLTTTTFTSTPNLDAELGMSALVFADLINSRDTISVSIILKLQRTLNIEVITKKELMDACKGYCEYLFTT